MVGKVRVMRMVHAGGLVREGGVTGRRHHGRRRGYGNSAGIGRVGKKLMGSVGLGDGILRGEETFRRGAVAFALGVLLEGVGHRDGPVAKVLAVHGLHWRVRGVEAGEVDESVALRVAGFGVSHNLGEEQRAKSEKWKESKLKYWSEENKNLDKQSIKQSINQSKNQSINRSTTARLKLHLSHSFFTAEIKYLWRLKNHAKRAECIIQQLLIHLGIKIPNENIRPDIQILLMSRSLLIMGQKSTQQRQWRTPHGSIYCQIKSKSAQFVYLINTDGFPIKFDHIHDFHRVIRVFLRHKLHEAVALMGERDAVFWHVDIHCGENKPKPVTHADKKQQRNPFYTHRPGRLAGKVPTRRLPRLSRPVLRNKRWHLDCARWSDLLPFSRERIERYPWIEFHGTIKTIAEKRNKTPADKKGEGKQNRRSNTLNTALNIHCNQSINQSIAHSWTVAVWCGA